MKHKNHTVSVYVYNPENLKEVLDIVKFNVKYIPTNKWNRFLIVVNNVFTGEEINIVDNISIRKKIAKVISDYKKGINISFQNRLKISYPNLETVKLSENIFNKKILVVNKFSDKDELRKYNLI